MKRIVGIGMIILGFLLCPVWVTAVPESEPEIGAIALIAILYLMAIGLVFSTSSSGANR
jgi:hypothetical protein